MACGAQSVYVGNLPASASEAKLKEVFEGLNCEVRPPLLTGSTHGSAWLGHADDAGRAQVVKVVMPAAKEGRPHREYGFVHFNERATAVKLVDDAEKGIKPSLDGNTLEVGLQLPLVGPFFAVQDVHEAMHLALRASVDKR